jgi:hypothetical protein
MRTKTCLTALGMDEKPYFVTFLNTHITNHGSLGINSTHVHSKKHTQFTVTCPRENLLSIRLASHSQPFPFYHLLSVINT